MKNYIRILRKLRGESLAHMRRRIRDAKQQMAQDGIRTNWYYCKVGAK